MTFMGARIDGIQWEKVILALAVVLGALLVAVTAALILFFLLERLARDPEKFPGMLLRRLRRPALLLIPLLALAGVVPYLQLPASLPPLLQHLLALATIAAIAWVVGSSTLACRDYLLTSYVSREENVFHARALRTQLTVATKILLVVVLVVALSAMLTTFAKIRAIGMSILASAGIAGIVVGFAAQRSIATLFAGVQLAITQPIRIQDQVMVEGEFGSIEEITLSYVVVKLWDQRTLVVPVTYFLEKPFQNWTRDSSQLLGTVLLHAEHALPVERLREKLHEILLASDQWDRRVWRLEVTDCSESSAELRAVMSAADAAASWELRCAVREKLLAYLRELREEAKQHG